MSERLINEKESQKLLEELSDFIKQSNGEYAVVCIGISSKYKFISALVDDPYHGIGLLEYGKSIFIREIDKNNSSRINAEVE